MALFVIERNLAEQLEMSPELLRTVEEYNADANLRWLFSFLSGDRKKTYCLYEAPDAESLRAQAEALGFPADVIVEVSELNPALYSSGASVTGHAATG